MVNLDGKEVYLDGKEPTVLGFLFAISFGNFPKLGVPYLGVLICYSGYYIRVPYFRKLPYNIVLKKVGCLGLR